MKDLNYKMDRLINRCWKLPFFVFLLVVLGIFCSPVKSAAQAVPPRSQGVQLIRPLVPQPEPPVQKEIRANREAIEKNKRELERKLEADRRASMMAMEKLKTSRWKDLNCFMEHFADWHKNPTCRACEPRLKPSEDKLNRCVQEAARLWHDLKTYEQRFAALTGGYVMETPSWKKLDSYMECFRGGPGSEYACQRSNCNKQSVEELMQCVQEASSLWRALQDKLQH